MRDSDYAVSPGQVLVTNGGKHAVYNTFAALLDPGDEVILPTPYWTTYPEAIRLADEAENLLGDTEFVGQGTARMRGRKGHPLGGDGNRRGDDRAWAEPAENAGGFSKMRPIATHGRRIMDYCSYRGLLILTGISADAGEENRHIIRSDDPAGAPAPERAAHDHGNRQ